LSPFTVLLVIAFSPLVKVGHGLTLRFYFSQETTTARSIARHCIGSNRPSGRAGTIFVRQLNNEGSMSAPGQ